MPKSSGLNDLVVFLSEDIPEVVETKEVLKVDCAPGKFVQKEIDLLDVNPELLTWLTERGLEIKLAEMFYCAPGSVVPDHYDDIEPEGCCKLIWTYGDEDIPLTWYTVKDHARPVYKNNSIGGYYLTCNKEDYAVDRKVMIKNPSLIRVDKLHGVSNITETDWCAVTLVLRKTGSSEHRAGWNELIEILPFKDSYE